VHRDGPRVAVLLESGGADPVSIWRALAVYDDHGYKGEFSAREQFEGHLLGVLLLENPGNTIQVGDRVSTGASEPKPTETVETMFDRRMPARCPKCGALPVIRILYGGRVPIPEEVLRGEAVQRGCWVSLGDPDWLCRKCGHEWFDPTDPGKQAWEAWLAEKWEHRVPPSAR
jgi:DNA-directed RNA polymerase subunit RPC12/RpoP